MSRVYELGFGKTDQEIKLDSIPVKGEIPLWLQGMLIRNGPGTFEVGKEHFRHWFDGFSMLHRFTFQGGRVAYANRFLQTRAYRESMEAKRIVYSEFATDPCRSLFGRAMAVFSPTTTDDAKVSLANLVGHYTALAETPIQVEFNPQTLDTVGNFQWESKPVGQMTTVHPTIDSARGEVYNLVVRYNALSHYNFYRMTEFGKPSLVGSIPVSQPAYLHSFGMSRNYLILAEFPLLVYPIRLLLWLAPYIENFRWKPDKGARFFVLHRGTGELVAQYDSDAYFAFHHVNAFERGDELVVDLVAYEDASILKAYYLDQLSKSGLELPFGKLRRYILPLKGKTVRYEVISESCMELSHFDSGRYNMRPDYRYVYAVGLRPEKRTGFYNQIIKIDIETRQETRWFDEDCYPGEPVFVARPGGTKEDDGVILSVVLDAAKGNSFLVVLDAGTLLELARAEVPQPILFGYHGAFFNVS
jgi:beta,beta-carotene 9',10'-dioxygenase